jgi:hypothetical protein
LDDVFALIRLFSREVDGMLEKSEDTVFKAPIEIAMAVIAGEDGSRCGANLLARLELALDDTFLECVRSNARRSSECTTNTRTPSSLDGTSWTSVFGGSFFSLAVMPTEHSIHGPVAR